MPRTKRYLAILLALAFLTSCKRTSTPAPPATPPGSSAADITELENRAVGLMGRFEFDPAIRVFTELRDKAPERAHNLVNLAIAYLNRQHEGDVQIAERFIDEALAKNPKDLRAFYCKAILLLNAGQPAKALDYFQQVASTDPADAYAVYYRGQCLLAANDPAGALAAFQAATRLDPSLRSAHYGAFQALQKLKRPDEAKLQLAAFDKLKDDPQARLVEFKYTRMGPKAEAAVDSAAAPAPTTRPSGPIFTDAAPLPLLNGNGLTWNPAKDGPPITITAADIDGDGRLDLFITNALLVNGELRNAILLQRDGGFQVDLNHPLAAVQSVNAALWGDFDNDGLTDVYLCRRGPSQLWRQIKPGQWQDVTEKAKASAGDHFNTIDGAFVDADHDGDLDLFLIRDDGPNELLNNNGDGTFRPIAKSSGIQGDGRGAIGLAITDLNHDGTADLIVLKREGPQEVYLNDRLWKYRPAEGFDEFRQARLTAAIAADLNGHGQIELLTASPTGLQRWSPDGENIWHATPIAATAATGPLAIADIEGTGLRSLLFSSPEGWSTITPGKNALPSLSIQTSTRARLLAELEPGHGPSVIAMLPGQPPIEWKPGPGRFPFVTLALSGRHQIADSMRSNASGVGVKLAARVDSRWITLDTYRPQSGPGQSAQPISFGLASSPKADFIRFIWPEGLQQTELDVTPGKLHRIEETQRQTSSCPVIFVWDGHRYVFVTDCLGVGGIGFAIGPNQYAPIRPWENILLPDGLLRAADGRFRLKLGEPMEEACYLDAASLVRFDLPPGWRMTLDERMGVNDPQPTGEPRFYRREMVPIRAVNDRGQDVTDLLARADGKATDPGTPDPRFVGFTAEHSIEMTFDRPIAGEPGKPMLVADGWIEYPYSQTMFAAWQAGVPCNAPTLEARDASGKWVTVMDQFGYPAGMPRQMSVPVPLEKLPPGATQLRLRTNQEIYWDRIAIAWSEPCPTVKRITLPLATATLADVGFPKRTTGPQRRPSYDYDHRAPLWDTRRQPGFYSQFGHVESLVNAIDDASAIFGPGEEIHLEFTATETPLPAGWTTRLVLELAGWCKDRDLYTKDGDTLTPLPARDGATPETLRRRDALHAQFNTRYQGEE